MTGRQLGLWAGRAGGGGQAWACPLAGELRGKLKWQPVDSQRDLANRLDISGTTVSEAKRFFADHGILAKRESMYYVA